MWYAPGCVAAGIHDDVKEDIADLLDEGAAAKLDLLVYCER